MHIKGVGAADLDARGEGLHERQQPRDRLGVAAATRCNTVQRIATEYNALQQSATRCNALQQSATRCNRVPRAATECNTLQQSATRCNRVQRAARSPTRTHVQASAARSRALRSCCVNMLPRREGYHAVRNSHGSRARLSRTSGASCTTSAAPSAMADGGGRPPSDASGTHSTSRTPATHRIGWLVARHRGGTSPGGCQLRHGGARLRGGRASTLTRTSRARAALARSPARPRPSPLLRQTHGRRCDAVATIATGGPRAIGRRAQAGWSTQSACRGYSK
jgi:hypothetical protein